MSGNWAWYASRTAGLVAYSLLWATVAVGLVTSAKVRAGKARQQFRSEHAVPAERKWRRTDWQDWHRAISAATWSFVAIHVFVLLFDTFVGFSLVELIVPFASDQYTIAVGLGAVAFEFGLAVAISFRMRCWIGRPVWRVLHWISYPIFVLVFVHAIWIGSDLGSPLAVGLFALSGLVLAGLGFLRFAAVPSPQERSQLVRQVRNPRRPVRARTCTRVRPQRPAPAQHTRSRR